MKSVFLDGVYLYRPVFVPIWVWQCYQQSHRFVGYSLMYGVYTAHYEYCMTPRVIGLCDKTASQSWKDDVVVTVWCLVFLFFFSLTNNFENFASQTQVAMVRHNYSLSKMTETLHPSCCVTNEGAWVAYILELFRLLKSIARAALSVSVNQCFHTLSLIHISEPTRRA